MKQLTPWNQRVADAKRDAVELPVSEDEVLIIEYPTKNQLTAFNAAARANDYDAMTVALLGEKAGNRIVELSGDEPGGVLDELLVDVLEEFGLRVGKQPSSVPNSSMASPNGSIATATQ